GLAVEPAPAADELVLAGVRLGQPQRALDRLGAARVHLQPVDAVGRRAAREPLEQLDPRLAGQRADRGARDLLLDRLDPGRVRVAERADRDPADEVEELVAVDVGDLGALGVIEDDAGHQRVALGTGSQVLVLARAQRLAFGAGHRGHEVAVLVRGLRHGAVFYRNARPIRTRRSTAARFPITATTASETTQ